MSKKQKRPLESLKTWKELEDYAENHGILYKNTQGGHNMHESPKGKMSFSTHEKEPGHDQRFDIIRQIKRYAMFCFLPFGLFIGWYLTQLPPQPPIMS